MFNHSLTVKGLSLILIVLHKLSEQLEKVWVKLGNSITKKRLFKYIENFTS